MYSYIKCYLLYLAERSQSPLTLHKVEGQLLRLRAAVPRSSWSEFSFDDIRALCSAMLCNGLSPRTINSYISTWRNFFSFLVSSGDIDANPMWPGYRLQVAKSDPIFINVDTLQRIRHSFCPISWKQHRGFVAFMILAFAGLRAHEAVALKWSDIDFDFFSINVVRGKNNKQRSVFARHAVAAIEDFKKIFGQRSEFVLSTAEGCALTTFQLRQVINCALAPFVAPRFSHPHVLRHSFATMLAYYGATVDEIAKQLGHSSTDTTMIYLHLANIYNFSI